MRPGGLHIPPVGAIVIFVAVATSLEVLASVQAAQTSGKLRGMFAHRIKKHHVIDTKGEKPTEKHKIDGCEEIYLPMCKGLVPYTHTRLPNRFNHTSQIQAYAELERLWGYMDHSCSKNLRYMICSTYLPKCDRGFPTQEPCQKMCTQAKRRCSTPLKKMFGLNWDDKFNCKGLPSRNCLHPVREAKCLYRRTACVENSLISICSNLTFAWGAMPNKFGQCNPEELNTEIQQYDALIATNCHQNLNFLICGVYSPFCVKYEDHFAFPCNDVCEEIRDACESHYKRLYHGLPWPQKLQCQRYAIGENTECVMPTEGGSTFFGV